MHTLPHGFLYLSHFLSAAEHDVLLQEVYGMKYQHDVFRGQRLKRAYAQFGYAYALTGHELTPAPSLPDVLLSVIARGSPYCPDDTRFNQCIVTHYPKGAGIGWHIDARCFGDVILAVSAGAAARLQFRPKGSKATSHEVLVRPGSLYVLSGSARWEYQHRVMPVTAVRYSLTFRQFSGLPKRLA
jgi:DNA oxidative demethylase